MNLFISCLFFFSLFSMIYVRKHILLCLMSLEFIVLSILFLVMFFSMMYLSSFYIYVFFMAFFVCEGVLGLSVLVLMIRFHGNDYLNSFFMW
uniref:NADH dehydrogenase subunit 4L n=1 Tax=Planaphrodes nigricans TaxID=3112130 RepID=UPI002E75A6F7|nr:NADH dehydrogenase subunit 4L [Planaphrodes nigricans]WRK21241.1 NADH dehydrogenase subunit 4L [Planaphrodes nigricans]